MNKIFKILLIIFLSFFSINSVVNSYEEKTKIGLLVPMTGNDKNLGHLIIKSTRMALEDIGNDKIEIFPKDTASNPDQTLKSALQLKDLGVKIVIGPIFYKNLVYLDDLQDIVFLSLTNKTVELPKNVISSGINATSQLNAIKKFLKLNEIKKSYKKGIQRIK